MPCATVLQPFASKALLALFTTLAARGPLVLLVDDWQWADDASNQVLATLVRALRHAPVLVLVGSRAIRSDDLLLADAPLVDLSPFTHDESVRAIRAFVPHAIDLGLSSAIHRRSGGSPLFLEELADSWLDKYGRGGATREEIVPPSLRDALMERIDRAGSAKRLAYPTSAWNR